MADEANTPAEPTTENAAVDTPAPAAEPVDTPDVGADVQGTETGEIEPVTEPAETGKEPKSFDEAYVKKLRQEAAAARVNGVAAAEKAAQEAAKAAQDELTEKLGRALGLISDDTPPDPADLLKAAQERETQLAADRDAVAEKLRNFERRDALTRAANTAEADLEAILDSRKVNEAIAKLDTNADDFAAQVAEIVSAAVETNPKLKKAPAQAAAPRSGGDMSGGNATPNSNGEKDIDFYRREYRTTRGFAD
ncbi:hypothetical protein ACFWU5_16245 [Nocardia sp. NPDC058640]|uniref:hypothetical protein n=1 Tax=Nocardia sp. NPDC058640 TaxID=3346571 RepID=UPI00364FBDB4